MLGQNCKTRQRGPLHIDEGATHQEDSMIVNTYASNIGTPKYILKQISADEKDRDIIQ